MRGTQSSRMARSTESWSLRSEDPWLIRRDPMKTLAKGDGMKTLTTHYIDGAFVESHGREVMDIVRPTDSQIIGRVTLADEEDTRRAVAAARRAFESYGRSTREDRAKI